MIISTHFKQVCEKNESITSFDTVQKSVYNEVFLEFEIAIKTIMFCLRIKKNDIMIL